MGGGVLGMGCVESFLCRLRSITVQGTFVRRKSVYPPVCPIVTLFLVVTRYISQATPVFPGMLSFWHFVCDFVKTTTH